MDEMFLEQMVKRGNAKKDMYRRILIVLCGIAVLGLPSLFGYYISYLVTPVLLVAVALIVWTLWRQSAKEYEYIYTDGNLDIDVIFGQSTRKHLVTFDCRMCRMIVPAKTTKYQHEIYDKKYGKTIYACKGEPDEDTYVILGKVGDIEYRVFFDPNERLITAIHQYSPKNSIVATRKIEQAEQQESTDENEIYK